MSNYCYICIQQPIDKSVDTIWVCNNCGGSMCERHGGRDVVSKNCWCDDCSNQVGAHSASTTAAVIEQILQDSDNPTRSRALAKEMILSIGVGNVPNVIDWNQIVAILRELADTLERVDLDSRRA